MLVVDDDPDIRTFVADLLAEEGYEVRTAANGRQAMHVLASWHPAVILLDLMMPEMDGRAFLAAQQTDADLILIPVIVMSASYNLKDGAALMAATDVLAKPFAIDQLLSKVETLVS